MMGDYVRDKDAVTASLIITEMAGWYAAQGMTLYDALRPCTSSTATGTVKRPTIW